MELVYCRGKDEPGHELCEFMLAVCQRAYGMLKSESYRPDAVTKLQKKKKKTFVNLSRRDNLYRGHSRKPSETCDGK